MAFDRHIVGRIGEDHVRHIALHQLTQRRIAQSIAAHDPMWTDLPDISNAGDRLAVWQVTFEAVILIGFRALIGEENVDLGRLEPGECEVEAQDLQIAQLDRKEVFVPAGTLGKLVVRDPVGTDFSIAQMLDPQCGCSL